MDFTELGNSIIDYTNGLIEIAVEQKSFAESGKVYNDLSKYYRSIGICFLLVEANTDDFFHYLIQSALTRKYYLEGCKAEDPVEHPARRASYVGPFFDAVATNQFRLATEIAANSPQEWMSDYEYEDDFLYAQFMFRLLLQPADRNAVQEILDRYAAVLEGNEDTRLDISRALLSADQDQFDSAFEALLDDYDTANAKIADPKNDSILRLNPEFEPNRMIFVEGLAIIKIAERLGLKTKQEYKLCPSIAQKATFKPFLPPAFPKIRWKVE